MADLTINDRDWNGVNEVYFKKKNGGGTEQKFVLPPSGTKSITANGSGIDVSEYAAVDVDVPTGITPTGTKSITANGTYDVTNFASANVNVSGSAPVLQQKSVTAPASGTTDVTPSSGYDGLSKVTVSPTPTETKNITSNGTYTPTSGKHFSQVTVNVSGGTPSTQEKTVTPTAAGVTVTPDSGKYLSKVTVSGDADLVAGNIKQGVDIFGVTGTYTGSGATLQTKTVTPTTSQQNVTPDSGYDGLSRVTVNAIQTETKSATPTAAAQTITPTSGKFLTSVTVNGDADLVAGNIKSGVNIFGVTGTYTGGGGGTSIEPTTDTWQHNTYVTLTVDIDEEGNLSIRQSAGGGTTTNLRICYPQGSTTTITKIPDIPTEPGDYELPITATWQGDSNNHTLNYTVVGGGGTITTEPLTVTQNGTYTAPSGKAYTPVTVNVSGGGSGGNIGQLSVTPTANATTVTISGLLGTPKWFMFFPTAAIPAASGSRRVTAHTYSGGDLHDYGWALISSGSSYYATYSVTPDDTNFTHSYSNGTLTLRSGSASTGGVYHNVLYALVYGY